MSAIAVWPWANDAIKLSLIYISCFVELEIGQAALTDCGGWHVFVLPDLLFSGRSISSGVTDGSRLCRSKKPIDLQRSISARLYHLRIEAQHLLPRVSVFAVDSL
jgi:hypothetical protein